MIIRHWSLKGISLIEREFSCQLTGLKAVGPPCEELQSWELRVASRQQLKIGVGPPAAAAAVALGSTAEHTDPHRYSVLVRTIHFTPAQDLNFSVFCKLTVGVAVRREMFFKNGTCDLSNTHKSSRALGWGSQRTAAGTLGTRADEPQLGYGF